MEFFCEAVGRRFSIDVGEAIRSAGHQGLRLGGDKQELCKGVVDAVLSSASSDLSVCLDAADSRVREIAYREMYNLLVDLHPAFDVCRKTVRRGSELLMYSTLLDAVISLPLRAFTGVLPLPDVQAWMQQISGVLPLEAALRLQKARAVAPDFRVRSELLRLWRLARRRLSTSNRQCLRIGKPLDLKMRVTLRMDALSQVPAPVGGESGDAARLRVISLCLADFQEVWRPLLERSVEEERRTIAFCVHAIASTEAEALSLEELSSLNKTRVVLYSPLFDQFVSMARSELKGLPSPRPTPDALDALMTSFLPEDHSDVAQKIGGKIRAVHVMQELFELRRVARKLAGIG